MADSTSWKKQSLDNILFHRAFERLPPCFTQGVFEVCEERGLTLVEIGEGVGVGDIRAATGASFQVHYRAPILLL